MRISPRLRHQNLQFLKPATAAQPSLPVIQLVESRVATAAASGTGAFREDAVHKRWSTLT